MITLDWPTKMPTSKCLPWYAPFNSLLLSRTLHSSPAEAPAPLLPPPACLLPRSGHQAPSTPSVFRWAGRFLRTPPRSGRQQLRLSTTRTPSTTRRRRCTTTTPSLPRRPPPPPPPPPSAPHRRPAGRPSTGRRTRRRRRSSRPTNLPEAAARSRSAALRLAPYPHPFPCAAW